MTDGRTDRQPGNIMSHRSTTAQDINITYLMFLRSHFSVSIYFYLNNKSKLTSNVPIEYHIEYL